MPDREYQIKISADSASATGEAKAVAEALKQTSAAAESSGKAHEEHGKKTRLFGEHMKEVKKVVSELGRDFPVAATIMRAAINPLGFAIGMVVTAFVALKREADAVSESFVRVTEAARQPVLAHRNLAGEVAASAASHFQLAAGANAASTAIDGLVGRMHDQTEAMRRQHEAQAAADNADKAREIAEVNFLMAQREADPTGRTGISSVEGARRLAAIEQRYTALGRQRQEESAAATAQAAQTHVRDINAQRGPLYNALQTAMRRLPQLENESAELERGQARFKRSGPDNKSAAEREEEAALEQAQSALDEIMQGHLPAAELARVGGIVNPSVLRDAAGRAQAKLTTQRRIAENAKKESDRYQERSATLAQRRAAAEADLRQAQTNWQAWQGEVSTAADAEASARANTASIRQQNQIVGRSADATATLNSGTNALHEVARQNAQDQTRANTIVSHGGNLNGQIAAGFAEYHAANLASQQQLLQEIRSATAELRRQHTMTRHLANSQQ